MQIEKTRLLVPQVKFREGIGIAGLRADQDVAGPRVLG